MYTSEAYNFKECFSNVILNLKVVLTKRYVIVNTNTLKYTVYKVELFSLYELMIHVVIIL